MVRLWSEEIGDAKSVIEPLIHEISPDTLVQINGGRGFSNETVEVVLQRDARSVRCIVTFEAWKNARRDANEMKAAFREIIKQMQAEGEPPAYLITSRGLSTEPADKDADLLRDIAAGTEADILAEQLPRRERQ